MAEEERKKSFWETLPGIITAIGGLLMGVAAVIAALNGGGKEGATKIDAPAAKPSSAPSASDDAAQRAAELERKLAEIASAKKQAEEEAEAAKAEAEQAKTEAAAALAQAAEAERKAAVIEEAARLAAEEEQAKTEEAEPQQGTIKIDDATGMKLAYVPGGCFMMGSPPNEEGREDDEGPVHKVCVDDFWMGQYEVTQGQWEKVMDVNPSKFKKGGNYPVENVFWDDAQEFIKKLNNHSGKSYRLPTEAEWEYACRAGGSSRYCGGDDLDAVAWYDKNSGGSTHPVGGKHENGFSLHDMSGNVWEWCADRYDSGYYASSPQSNPVGPDSGSNRVIRGGCWGNSPWGVRAANRDWLTPDSRDSFLGFRLVLLGQQCGFIQSATSAAAHARHRRFHRWC